MRKNAKSGDGEEISAKRKNGLINGSKFTRIAASSCGHPAQKSIAIFFPRCNPVLLRQYNRFIGFCFA